METQTLSLIQEWKLLSSQLSDKKVPAARRHLAAVKALRVENEVRVKLHKKNLQEGVSPEALKAAARTVAHAGYPVIARRLEAQEYRSLAFVPFRDRDHLRDYLKTHTEDKVAEKAMRKIPKT